MENWKTKPAANGKFADRIEYELKRAERYRIFVSLLIFNFESILSEIVDERINSSEDKDVFLGTVKGLIRESVREVDSVSNSDFRIVGVLCPETSRQGAEAAARRIQEALNGYISDYLGESPKVLIPVEISSYPDAAGARSLASYSEEFS